MNKSTIFMAAAFVLAIGSAFTTKAARFDQPAYAKSGTTCTVGSVNDECLLTNTGITCTIAGQSAYDTFENCSDQGQVGLLKRPN